MKFYYPFQCEGKIKRTDNKIWQIPIEKKFHKFKFHIKLKLLNLKNLDLKHAKLCQVLNLRCSERFSFHRNNAQMVKLLQPNNPSSQLLGFSSNYVMAIEN